MIMDYTLLKYFIILIKFTGLLDNLDIRTLMLDRDIWRDLSNTNSRVEDQQDYSRNLYISKYIIILIIIK